MDGGELEAFAASLHIDTSDLEQVFRLLSNDGRDSVDVDSFVMGCMKIKGTAKSMDVCALLHEQHKAKEANDDFQKLCKDSLGRINARMEYLLKVMPDQVTSPHPRFLLAPGGTGDCGDGGSNLLVQPRYIQL
eukprot:gnl/TRDRNA2_/TRDRNA2_167691_c1_seq5.p1 gnl/TRDRNA2_/TRDRNA2_167691_c1~~gnl/TRDRNA2_/TRDRNA2_167691_c1_seq5.p1  ORF type:complete len:133 (+),score=23.13 gnl/TRDRNA2_/TRDRNA2_167691_c1_seq5:174-572(+)